MYTGINRENQRKTIKKPRKFTSKYQLLMHEPIESNGIITEQLVFKTKEFKADPTISWRDFEIANLIAAGIDPNSLPSTKLPINMEELNEKATNSEDYLTQLEIIKEYYNEPATEQTQQTEPQA